MPASSASAASVRSASTTIRRAASGSRPSPLPVRQTIPGAPKAASRWIEPQSASIRSAGSSGPPSSGSGSGEGTSGTAEAASSPLAASASSAPASPPLRSFSSQIPIPSKPAAAYTARSSSKLAARVVISEIE